MNYWFTSDLHLGHKNIIKYCARTLFMTKHDVKIYNNLGIDKQGRYILSDETLNNMNNILIKRWNERVKSNDTVFHIGDFCFRNSSSKKGEGVKIQALEWEKQLNGKIIHIKGNHDKNNSTKTIIEKLVIGYGGKRINLVHNPEFSDSNYDFNFTGHIHNNWQIKRIVKGFRYTDAINVGVDVWNYYPVKFEEIMKRYNKWLKLGEFENE